MNIQTRTVEEMRNGWYRYFLVSEYDDTEHLLKRKKSIILQKGDLKAFKLKYILSKKQSGKGDVLNHTISNNNVIIVINRIKETNY